jgi:hypothetical protein
MTLLNRNVRFAPKSGHRSARRQCPLCAKSGSRRNQITEIDSIAYVNGGGMIKSLSTSN